MSIKQLVIVESPAKAKTIAKFLGSDYSVKSSFGHIRDLPKKGLNIDKDNNFLPFYEISADKKRVVSELKKEAKNAPVVWLASDEDREGEAIAWHLAQALSLKPENTKRIVFHEITKHAIDEAIKNPREIDIDLVNAQQARRVLDRLVGYELSPVLWKKVQAGLSAGRVQSVAVRLIVEREREIENFISKSTFKITAIVTINDQTVNVELNTRLTTEAKVKSFLNDLISSKLKVTDISEKSSERNPSAPFTTSTLQQEAARKLGFSVKQTMTLAQRLYENGHITYMRTDSTNLSGLAINAMSDYIKQTFGENYYKLRQYQTKNKSAQEAHEAIRPTNIDILEAGEEGGQQKLYKLIWKRSVASQMAAAKTMKTEVDISLDNRSEVLLAKGEVLKFDGYLKVYGGGKDDSILPEIKMGDIPTLNSVEACQIFSRPSARYSEASLVKTLEELGIGRPSTYAPTISTIQSRGYIEKADVEEKTRVAIKFTLNDSRIDKKECDETFGGDKNKLLPTHLAEVTTDFLVRYFDSIINDNFTATIEQQFDEVASGNLVWETAIKDFYDKFHPLVEKAGEASRQETSQARLLGQDPKSGKPIYARFGRYGPMLQRGEVEGSEIKPDFAPMPANTKLNEVTLEQALSMFGLPRKVGKTKDGKDISANIGRFGPYIVVDKTFVSIKSLDPFTITEEEAKKLYEEKLITVAKRELKKFEGTDILIIKGPYGPYVTDGKKNARIAKNVVPEDITLEEAKEMIQKSKPSRKRIIKRRKH